MNTECGWFNLYKAAVLETEWSKIEERIQVAENGIKARLNEFAHKSLRGTRRNSIH